MYAGVLGSSVTLVMRYYITTQLACAPLACTISSSGALAERYVLIPWVGSAVILLAGLILLIKGTIANLRPMARAIP